MAGSKGDEKFVLKLQQLVLYQYHITWKLLTSWIVLKKYEYALHIIRLYWNGTGGVISFHLEVRVFPVLHNNYRDYWWPGATKSDYDISIVCKQYFIAHTSSANKCVYCESYNGSSIQISLYKDMIYYHPR